MMSEVVLSAQMIARGRHAAGNNHSQMVSLFICLSDMLLVFLNLGFLECNIKNINIYFSTYLLEITIIHVPYDTV